MLILLKKCPFQQILNQKQIIYWHTDFDLTIKKNIEFFLINSINWSYWILIHLTILEN